MLRRLVIPLVVALLLAVSSPAVAARRAGSGHAAVRGSAARPDPVLLVHGFHSSNRGWYALEDALRAVGYRDSEIAAVDYSDGASNVDIAHEIAREADALRARTGAARIDVVSHSMGAISSRYWVERLGGSARVDAWVSLAGVNAGTVWAYGCYVLTQCREMVPTSPVIEGLNDGFRASGPTRYGAWWSPCDEAIVPHTNAELRGARNVETRCLDHTEMRTDPGVLDQVVHFLRGSPPGV